MTDTAPSISEIFLKQLHLGSAESEVFPTYSVRRGREHVYLPTVPRRRIQRQAAGDLLRTLFQGPLSAAVSALLDAKEGELDDAEAARLRRLIDEAEAEGR